MCDISHMLHFRDIVPLSPWQGGLNVGWLIPPKPPEAAETWTSTTPLIPKCPTTNLTFEKTIPAPDVTSRSHIISMSCPLSSCFSLSRGMSLSSPVSPFCCFGLWFSHLFPHVFYSTCVVFPFTPFVAFLLFFPSHHFLSFVLVPRAHIRLSDKDSFLFKKRPNLTLFWCEEKIAYSVTLLFLSALLF